MTQDPIDQDKIFDQMLQEVVNEFDAAEILAEFLADLKETPAPIVRRVLSSRK